MFATLYAEFKDQTAGYKALVYAQEEIKLCKKQIKFIGSCMSGNESKDIFTIKNGVRTKITHDFSQINTFDDIHLPGVMACSVTGKQLPPPTEEAVVPEQAVVSEQAAEPKQAKPAIQEAFNFETHKSNLENSITKQKNQSLLEYKTIYKKQKGEINKLFEETFEKGEGVQLKDNEIEGLYKPESDPAPAADDPEAKKAQEKFKAHVKKHYEKFKKGVTKIQGLAKREKSSTKSIF